MADIGTRKAHVVTDLLYEQLAKDLLLYCVFKRDTNFLRKAYCVASVASLLGRI